MKFGVCGDPKSAPVLAEAGFDFIEINVQRRLKPAEQEEAFAPDLEEMRTCALPCRAANGFLPKDLKVTGPEASLEALTRYAETACDRARRAGVEIIVFGSGAARRVPDDFDPAAAREQLLAFGRALGPIADRHGVVIAVEPLRRAESNVLNSVTEGADYVRDVDHPNVRLLVDAFHWNFEGESTEAIASNGPLLRHAHIAVYQSRVVPGREPCDFSDFFGALKRAGYDGGVSIEGKWDNQAAEAARALEELKRFAKAAGL